MKRGVVTWAFVRLPHTPRNGGTRFLKLTCGHEKAQKASARIPIRTECRECPRA